MGARVYDPAIGRFTAADPTIPGAMNGQAFNRYAYVLNNPLIYTDPNGYGFSFNPFKLITHIFNGVTNAASPIFHSSIVQAVEVVAAYFACGQGASGAACAAGVSGTNTGVNGGDLGDSVKAAAITFATAEAFQAVNAPGAITNPAARIAASATIGGLSSVASGGNFQSGFLAAGFTSLAGPIIPKGDVVAGTFVAATIGGTASTIGGGKFLNGAVTGAFAYAVGGGGIGDNSGPTLSQGTGGVAFVGGFFDYWNPFGGQVLRSYYAYTATGADAAYFTWDQGGALGAWLDANAGTVTAVYGQ
jgi:hypothetical protein